MPWKPNHPGEIPSLGWSILEHASAFLPSPRDETQPLLFSDEQARDIIEWYSLDPATGRFIHHRGAKVGAKGIGKSPWAGVLMIEELVGEVVFDGWDANGQPVGRPWGTGGLPPPLGQIAAVSEDQGENTYGALYQLLTANNGKAADLLRIDAGMTRCLLRDRPGSLETVTKAADSREGQPLTSAVLDETELWTQSNGGVRMARTIRRNVTKMNGRTMETANAPVLGEHSVAEQTMTDVAEGKRGILLLFRRPEAEPQPDWPVERRRAALDEVYSSAWWVDRQRVLDDIDDMPWEDALRFFFNVPSPGGARAMDPRLWESRRAAPYGGATVPPAGTRIGAGFDGSVSRDETFLGGCTADGWSFVIERWARPPGAPRGWTVSRTQVDAAIARTFATWDVGLLLYDPPFWRTEGEGWARQYGEDRVVALDTNQPSRFAPAVERWRAGLETGDHTHSGDEHVTRHVLDARLRKVHLRSDDDDGRTRYVLVKGSSGDRIDGAVMDVLAYEAAKTMDPEPASYVVDAEDLVFAYH